MYEKCYIAVDRYHEWYISSTKHPSPMWREPYALQVGWMQVPEGCSKHDTFVMNNKTYCTHMISDDGWALALIPSQFVTFEEDYQITQS